MVLFWAQSDLLGLLLMMLGLRCLARAPQISAIQGLQAFGEDFGDPNEAPQGMKPGDLVRRKRGVESKDLNIPGSGPTPRIFLNIS